MPARSYFHVDAFTDRAFGGGPAAVFVSDEAIDPKLARMITAESGQGVAVFLRPGGDACEARLFTPQSEVGFIGHASHAAAYVYLRYVQPDRTDAAFESPIGGTLSIARRGDMVTIELAAMPGIPVDNIAGVSAALPGYTIIERLRAEFGPVVVLEKEADVLNAAPDMSLIERIEGSAFILTALGDKVDFVSRVFAPKLGLQEDPVCGTAHRIMVPYWASRLARKKLTAHQVSWRGGVLECELRNASILLSGHGVCLMRGQLEA